jgi:hypothetical protein
VGSDRWRQLFHDSLPQLKELSHQIAISRHWTAGALLRLIAAMKIPYFGPKTTRLAVRWLSELVDDIAVDMRDSELPVDSAPQRRRSPVEGGSTHVVVGETW